MSIITQREDKLIGNMALLEDTLLQYEYLLSFAEEVEDLAPDERTAQTLVRGCTSQAWISLEVDGEGGVRLRGASEALVIRGIMGIMCALTRKAPCAEVASWEPRFTEDANFAAHIGPSRRGGIAAMIKRIREFARQEAGGRVASAYRSRAPSPVIRRLLSPARRPIIRRLPHLPDLRLFPPPPSQNPPLPSPRLSPSARLMPPALPRRVKRPILPSPAQAMAILSRSCEIGCNLSYNP